MQFFYSAFSCRSALELSLADLLYPSPAQLRGSIHPLVNTLQGDTGNLRTIAISVYSQVLFYG